MDGARHGRWLAAGLLAAIMVSVGVLATTSSGYVDVSELAGYEEPVTVMVKGRVTNVELRPHDDLVVFTLQGEGGFILEAYYSLSRFQRLYGGPPSHVAIDEEVVLRGVFYPAKQGRLVGYLEVTDILQGCHGAYGAPPVSG